MFSSTKRKLRRAWYTSVRVVRRTYRRLRAPKVPVCYLAHPVNAQTAEGIRQNLGDAKAWLAYLMRQYPDRAFCAPWIPMVEAIGGDQERSNRARGMRDDLAILERCDEIWLVGPRISPGMFEELAHAEWHGLRINNLVGKVPVTVRERRL